MESELYLEIIQSADGEHRLGIAYPNPGGTALESREVALREEGNVEKVAMSDHTLTLYFRYRRES